MAVIDALRPMKDREAGETLVRDVRVDIREDSQGVEALFVSLVLADPPSGRESWPVDDLRELRNWVRELLSQLSPPAANWYVMFEPEHPDLDDEDDQLELHV